MIHIRKQAFTLVELLTVLAIVSVLAAILFPVFAKAREMDRQTACASNLKKLGIAFAEYTHDNNGYFPGVARQDAGWAYPLFPYVKNNSAYQCPDEVIPPLPSDLVHISYGQNSNFNAHPDATLNQIDRTFVGGSPVGLAQMTSPALTVALFETGVKIKGASSFSNTMASSNNEGSSDTGNGYDEMWTARYATGPLGGRPGKDSLGGPTFSAPRHTQGSNFLAVDGHVKYLVGSKVSNGFSPPNATDPQGQHAPSGGAYTAAGTSSMTSDSGAKFAMTFSTK